MWSLRRIRWFAREWIAAALCLTLVGVGVAVFREPWRSSPYRLSISAGSVEGLRSRIAERLAEEAAGRGVLLSVVGTSGSWEALNRLEAGRLDLAMVQGGLDPTFHPHVRQVASLHIEPLHLLVKDEIFAQVSQSLGALKGRRVNIGPVGSGTHELSRDFLRFAGLLPPGERGGGDYTVETLSYAELLARVQSADLPDAVFSVSALPSPVVHALARRHFRLVSLPFGEAYALSSLDRRDGGSPRESKDGPDDVSKVYIYPTQIPAFTYGIEPAVPPASLSTFGPRLLLVAHQDVSPRAVRRILETVFSPRFAQLSRPSLDVKLLETLPEYNWHPGTEEFVEYNKPLLAGELIDLLEKTCSLAGAILGASFFLWQWIRQRYRRRRDLGFESYMVKVAAIEEQALAQEMEALLDIKELLRLQRELAMLKNQALGRFADGKLVGTELLSGFLSHVNDARNYLNRLTLHQRDNLEDRAVSERRPAEAIWSEVLGESQPAEPASEPGGQGPDRLPPPGEPSARDGRSDDVEARGPTGALPLGPLLP
jgi:TRAP-type uncharacterized transport system substrate-binding protein